MVPVSKSGHELDPFFGGDVGEHGVHSTERLDEFCPMTPIALPFLVIRRHDSSVDASPLSSEKTRKANLLLKRKPRHKSFCNGKVVANVCKNSSSETVNVVVLAVLRWNVREAASAIRLLSPAMDTKRVRLHWHGCAWRGLGLVVRLLASRRS